jgi:hypothetical protein
MWGEDNAKQGNKGLKRAIKIFNGISKKIVEKPAQRRLQIKQIEYTIYLLLSGIPAGYCQS